MSGSSAQVNGQSTTIQVNRPRLLPRKPPKVYDEWAPKLGTRYARRLSTPMEARQRATHALPTAIAMRQAVKELRGAGFAVCKIAPGEKRPTAPGWSTRSLEAEDFSDADQVGILAGPLSNGGKTGHALVIIDLDARDAVAGADEYLPATGMSEGRPGKRRSHRYYLVPFSSIPDDERSTAAQAAEAARLERGHPGPKTVSYRHAESKAEIVRLIGTGGQAVCAPSLHDSGERRGWDGGSIGEPAIVSYVELKAAVEKLAKVCGYVSKDESSPADTVRTPTVPNGAIERRAVAYLAKMEPSVSGQGGHDKLFTAACRLWNGFGLDEATAFKILKNHFNPLCRPVWSDADLKHKIRDAAKTKHEQPRGYLLQSEATTTTAESRLTSLARAFLSTFPDGALRYWRDEFHEWIDGAYRTIVKDEMNGRLTAFVSAELVRRWNSITEKKNPEPDGATLELIKNVFNHLRTLEGVTIPSDVDAPVWLNSESQYVAKEMLATPKHLIHVPSGERLETTPAFFSFNRADIDIDAEGAKRLPVCWVKFLKQLWPDDKASIQTLQELFGYLLTTDTSQQKIFALIGPKRAGKGTILKILTRLVGNRNVAAITLGDLGRDFGPSALLGKSVATISDARLGAGGSAIVEKLLSISGEDLQPINRKFLPAVSVRLPVRFIVAGNELPRFRDDSGAIVSRFILLRLSKSFLGVEDHKLESRLLNELPQILHWAIEGLKRLNTRGRFEQPNSASDLLEAFNDNSSGVAAFVRESCELGAGNAIGKEELYTAFTKYCEQTGRTYVPDLARFAGDLYAACPEVSSTRTRTSKGRSYGFVGIITRGNRRFSDDPRVKQAEDEARREKTEEIWEEHVARLRAESKSEAAEEAAAEAAERAEWRMMLEPEIRAEVAAEISMRREAEYHAARKATQEAGQ